MIAFVAVPYAGWPAFVNDRERERSTWDDLNYNHNCNQDHQRSMHPHQCFRSLGAYGTAGQRPRRQGG